MSKDDKDRVKRHIVDSSVGINNARIIVSGGKIHIPTPAVGDLARFGGAGLLTVQEGYAVVLERGGRRTRIVGTGVHFLNIFERVDLVVPLVLCTDAIEVENIITQGRIIIGKIKLIVFSRVDAGNRSHTNGEFSFEDKIVNDLIWHPRDSAEVYSWSLTIKKYAEIALRDLAAGLALDDLVLASGKTRDKLRSNLITAINRVTKDKLGIVVTNVEIGEIVLPKERERAPDRMHVEIPIPAQLTIDRYLEDVQDTMLAIDSIYSIIGLVSAGDREVIAHFVAFMREQTNYSAVSNMQLQRFLSAAGIAPLRLATLHYGSPNSFSLIGLDSILNPVRDIIKDIVWRAKHEEESARADLDQKRLDIEKTKLEIADKVIEAIEKVNRLGLSEGERQVIVQSILSPLLKVASASYPPIVQLNFDSPALPPGGNPENLSQRGVHPNTRI
jgi:hypothetical protein